MALGTIGCAAEAPPGNAALEISRFQTQETATKTTVIGFDAAGNEVGRVELIHGRFTLTGSFTEDYDVPEVDGRKLDVSIHGEPQMVWETAGYAPTLHMPAHPASQVTLAAFLDDPHVKSVLDRWQIGFEPVQPPSYTALVGTQPGTSPYDCLSDPNDTNHTACGTARTFTINTCGGGTTPSQARRVTHSTPTAVYDEYVIAQCCPPVGTITTKWFAVKSCPTTGTGAQASTCGTTGATAACKGCAGYPADATGFCSIATTGSELAWCYDATPGQPLTVQVQANGTGGVVQVDSASGFPRDTFADGTTTLDRCSDDTVVLTASNPSPYAWTFVGWSGGCTGTALTCSVTMNAARSVVATFAGCGDGVISGGEVCDDGNRINDDGCDNNCTPTGCGNGIVTGTEACDDGNTTDGDGCDTNCTATGCGNGIVSTGEVCDDGNLTSGDGCDSNCTPTSCGNGIVSTNEACDDGNLTNGDGCDSTCTPTGCGNGLLTGTETCDDGNLTNGDGCDSNCTLSLCGNGIVSNSEVCDDGNTTNGDACNADCTLPSCGDGIVNRNEACDDGNAVDGDGCDATCVRSSTAGGCNVGGDPGNAGALVLGLVGVGLRRRRRAAR